LSNTSSSFNWDELTFTEHDEHLNADQRWSSWGSVERLCRGPEPWPDWLVTGDAVDTDLGVLKTGKEADVSLVERAALDDPELTCLLAAKRYRATTHRLFHRDTGYTEGRHIRNSRDTRAMARKSEHGRQVEAGLWANAEWVALKRLWLAGVPVPYPVQIDGGEILMEYIADAGGAAPRLHQTRPSPAELDALFSQLLDALVAMAGLGVVHGDLSPYNTLVTGVGSGDPRLVVIDVPQLVDLYANPNADEFLHRDCTNMAAWFTSRGHGVDAEELFAEVISQAW
jgi:RIO kinase 1